MICLGFCLDLTPVEISCLRFGLDFTAVGYGVPRLSGRFTPPGNDVLAIPSLSPWPRPGPVTTHSYSLAMHPKHIEITLFVLILSFCRIDEFDGLFYKLLTRTAQAYMRSTRKMFRIWCQMRQMCHCTQNGRLLLCYDPALGLC